MNNKTICVNLLSLAGLLVIDYLTDSPQLEFLEIYYSVDDWLLGGRLATHSSNTIMNNNRYVEILYQFLVKLDSRLKSFL